MVSEENLKFLRERGGQYIVGTPKQMLRAVRAAPDRAELDAGAGRRGGEARPGARRRRDVSPGPQRRPPREGTGDAREVHGAVGSGAAEDASGGRGAGRLKEEAAAGERLGRLKQQNWRASHAFDVSLTWVTTRFACTGPCGPRGRWRFAGACGRVRRRANDSDSALAIVGYRSPGPVGPNDGGSSVERTSYRDFAGLVPTTRALHCRPWTPASLFSCSFEGHPNRVGSLSQNQPPRFHLNCEPRQNRCHKPPWIMYQLKKRSENDP